MPAQPAGRTAVRMDALKVRIQAAMDVHARRVFVKKTPFAAMDSGTSSAPPFAMRAEGIVRAPPQAVRSFRVRDVEDAHARPVYANWTPSAATPVGTAFARVNARTPVVKTAAPQSHPFVAMEPVVRTKPVGHAPPIAEHVRRGAFERFTSFPRDRRFPSTGMALDHL